MTKKKQPKLIKTAKSLGIFILVGIVVYAFLNAPALISRINFWIGGDKKGDQNIEVTDNGVSKSDQRGNLINNRLYIPKINVDAKIIWGVTYEDSGAKLKQGVIQLKGTALPGQTGNMFITGHSSYYWWFGKYTNIFALLPKISVGDRIVVVYNGKVYTYKVVSTQVVKPSQTEVMDQGNKKELSLMTCVPIGTNLNRLIVKAEQVAVQDR